jgi:hypothetical protein
MRIGWGVVLISAGASVPDELVVLGVRPDPEPDQVSTFFDRKRPVVQSNASRPESAHRPEV